ncbi:hypothetical protein HMPREF3223_00443 [Cutibacterium avidum]|nr:hypothetical protein HMPREF3223_00443 [Cutibacterium avidum]
MNERVAIRADREAALINLLEVRHDSLVIRLRRKFSGELRLASR